jgi:hypothetical protein
MKRSDFWTQLHADPHLSYADRLIGLLAFDRSSVPSILEVLEHFEDSKVSLNPTRVRIALARLAECGHLVSLDDDVASA